MRMERRLRKRGLRAARLEKAERGACMARSEQPKGTDKTPLPQIVRQGATGLCLLRAGRRRQQRLLFLPGETLDLNIAPQRGGAVCAGLAVYDRDGQAAAGIFCAVSAVVLPRAPVHVGGYAGVECVVGAAQQIDIPNP